MSEEYEFISDTTRADRKGQEMTFDEVQHYLKSSYDEYDQMIADVVISLKKVLEAGFVVIPEDYNIHVGEGNDDPIIEELCRYAKKDNPDTFTEENLQKLEERMVLYGSMILTERATMDQQNTLVRMFEERFGVPREGNLINLAVIDILNGILVSQEGCDMRTFTRLGLDDHRLNGGSL